MKANSEHIALRVVAAAVVTVALGSILVTTGILVTSNRQSLTRRVVDVPFERALEEYCAVLENVDGVVSVTYDKYDPLTKSAYVSVTFDPSVTSPQILMVYFGHTKAIWTRPVAV